MQTGVAHRLERVVHVRGGLPVHDQGVGAGSRVLLHPPLGPLDHQVHVEHAAALVHEVAQRADHQVADGDRRHEVAVHHVHVDDPRARVHHLFDLGAEAGEVGGEDRGRNAPVSHEVMDHAGADLNKSGGDPVSRTPAGPALAEPRPPGEASGRD